ncbi:tyrosine-type recombinase/integrase [Bilifractor sp. LCP19S3_H10]|uniref:tyrosine-type recombinase/integrase n=1 Tax=Bilifractor sp. LCP19S3_H10 TaxID=3438736 RepID=UPI003F90934C
MKSGKLQATEARADDRGIHRFSLLLKEWKTSGRPALEHYFRNAVNRYNEIYRVQMPAITPHVCRYTYCSNMARAGINPKTLQYLMGHSGISVTMNTYTHLGLEDAENELRRLSEINSARAELDRLNGSDFSIESNVKFG